MKDDNEFVEGTGVKVRDLTDEEKQRMTECLNWLRAERRPGEPQGQDEETERNVYDLRQDEARNRWPDVAKLIGF